MVDFRSGGGMPDHIRILGNDFAKSVKGKLDWETETFSGITPNGEAFCIPVDFTKQNHNNCVHAVESTLTKGKKSHRPASDHAKRNSPG